MIYFDRYYQRLRNLRCSCLSLRFEALSKGHFLSPKMLQKKDGSSLKSHPFNTVDRQLAILPEVSYLSTLPMFG